MRILYTLGRGEFHSTILGVRGGNPAQSPQMG